MAKHLDDPSTNPTILVTLVFVLLVVITILGLEAYFRLSAQRELTEKVLKQPVQSRNLVQTQQREAISQYRWVDREAGTVAIPVERAMELVASELSAEGGRQ